MSAETPPLHSDPSDRKSDNGGDDDATSPLSRYSSFGESEYDRYCSANSAMGTPSMCSSVTVFNDFPELDFGDSFSSGGRSSSNREDPRLLSSGGDVTDVIRGRPGGAKYGITGVELYGNDDDDDDVGVCGDASEMMMSWKVEETSGKRGSELKCGSECSDEEEEESEEGGGVVAVEHKDLMRGGSRVVEERSLEGGKVEREEGGSLRDEYSEDEGSMYNGGTEDEDKSEFDDWRGVEINEESKRKNENENPFLMNSSVAFGSDDWDDYMQESAQSNIDVFNRSVFRDRIEMNAEAERKFLNSVPVVNQTVPRKDVTDTPRSSEHVEADTTVAENFERIRDFAETKDVQDMRDVPVASYQVQPNDDLVKVTKISITAATGFEEPERKEVKDIASTKNTSPGLDELANNLIDSEAIEAPEEKGSDAVVDDMSNGHTSIKTEVAGIDGGQDLCKTLGKIKVKLDPLSEISSSPEIMKEELFEDHKPNTSTLTFENNTRKNAPAWGDHSEEYDMPHKTNNLELNEFYDEFVNDMEEILLDSAESPGARFSHGNRNLQSQLSLPQRDGGSTASTSNTGDAYLFNQHALRVDGVEVVGARQKKGDVSFSERLVGVKEYTVYKMKVWSGKDQWEVERRYRDFFTLYRRLKTLFADHGWNLPSPWSAVEKESRKIFGNASPDVIAERSILIQECLESVLHYRFFSSPPSALVWFLSPQDSFPSSMSPNTPDSGNIQGNTENVSTLGKTISLIVEVRPYKSLKQMLEAQHYMCAGCHKHFDDGKTLIRDFAQTLGWGKPRLCEYTGQLFCSSCHTNEIAVIPARVLHHWDFTQYSVSQLAKSYLDSILDQPMLCVSAVNPFLFTKVPALLQVMGARKKIGTMLPYVRCPFCRSINKGLGSRKYLLESNDFFALRDLINLSKGAFAVMPVMVETISSKICGHITEQCLICCDVGVPCGARQACNDPSSLIFPFQEDDIERCTSCESVFHKLCFKKLLSCHCGEQLSLDEPTQLGSKKNSVLGLEVSGVLDLFGKGSGSGLLSGLFSKAKADSPSEHKEGDNVILMGSFPPNSL